VKLIVSLLVVGVAAASCSGNMCGCPPYYNPPAALTWGHIALANGSPASGAALRASVTAVTDPCVQDTMQFMGLANPSGNYHLEVENTHGSIADSACVFLRASYPGEAPQTQAATRGPFILKFAVDPVDTVHVDFELVPVATPASRHP